MQSKIKYYPYPILNNSNQYYTSSFKTELEYKMDGYDLIIIIKTLLNDSCLNSLLAARKVAVIHHIECPQTCFRRAFTTFKKDENICLEDKEINGTITVNSFIIANENLENYTNPNFSADYKDMSFNLEKGSVIAIGNSYTIKINKVKDDLADCSSIFSIIPSYDAQQRTLNIDLNKEKITISLPEKTYKQFAAIQQNNDIQPILHSMIIVPALQHTLQIIRDENARLEYEDYRWFSSLKNKCKSLLKIDIESNQVTESELFSAAQKLINAPLGNAIEYLCKGRKSDDEA